VPRAIRDVAMRHAWPLQTFPREALSGLGEDADQGAEQFRHCPGTAGIVDHLPLAPGLNQTKTAQLGQMLRQGRLTEGDALGDRTDRQFPLRQMTHDGKAFSIAEKRKDFRDFVRALDQPRR
jgi:hypothetical protein